MVRRFFQMVLLVAGIVPLVWGVCIFTGDPRRASVLMTIATMGIVLNGVALSTGKPAIRLPLRLIAFGMATIVIAAVLGMWYWIRTELLPETPSVAEFRLALLTTHSHNLLWIAAAVCHVVITVFLLPTAPPKPPVDPAAKRQIDFRTYGR